MKNLELAWILAEIGDLLELQGENPFKVRAYRRAARAIELLPEDIEAVWRRGELGRIEGIGKALEEKIDEWLSTGVMTYYEELRRQLPPGLRELTRVPGVGPKLAQRLYQELGIRNLDELEAACREQRLRHVKGLGARSEENILRGIERLRRQMERFPLGLALPVAQQLVRALAEFPSVQRVAIAGSLRRGRETVGDVDIVASSADPASVMDEFVRTPGVEQVLARGDTKASIVLKMGLQVDLRVVRDDQFAAALHHFTGSKEHNVALRELAQAKGLKISEYGIVRVDEGEPLAVATEADVFAAVGLPCIPPELREDGSEIAAAREGRLPALITLGDIKGDLHVHSEWSDGLHSIEAMALAARERGYEYIAITDHSPSLSVARGLDPSRLEEQLEEIARLNRRLDGIRILTGCEVDILRDGSLDLPDEILARLDVVVASVHSAMNLDEAEMTERIVAAMRNPHVDIIGHPTGRILGRREPYAVDMERIIAVAAETGTCLEINASPDRLDLKDVHARWARERGVMIVINTDAHSTDGLDQMAYGVTVARRAWLGKADVLNCLSWPELKARLKDGRR
ncbi:MAG TPA: DNA polymerase/3'-5' exonuclease PolX [Limnochordales bacterium]|nr:DNA polymerase/3'-5' exonuclease PolX [Bacillota bacterium]